MRLKSGMNVRVVSGNHKGKEGKILKILKNKNRVIIEGVNLIKNIPDLLRQSQRWNCRKRRISSYFKRYVFT